MEDLPTAIRSALKLALGHLALKCTVKEFDGLLRARFTGWTKAHEVQVTLLNQVRNTLNNRDWKFGEQRWSLLRWVSRAQKCVTEEKLDIDNCAKQVLKWIPAALDFWFAPHEKAHEQEDPEEKRLLEGYPRYKDDEPMDPEAREELRAAIVVANTKKSMRNKRKVDLESMVPRPVAPESPRSNGFCNKTPDFTYADVDEFDAFLRYMRGSQSPSRVSVHLIMDRSTPELGPTLVGRVGPYPLLSDTNFAFFHWLYQKDVSFTLYPLKGTTTASCNPTLW